VLRQRLGKDDHYCSIRDGSAASQLVEPGTPCLERKQGSVSNSNRGGLL
jgi:hypothetical protein